MKKGVHLKQFTVDELVLSEQDAVLVLKFIFASKHDVIDGMVIDDRVRSFAQGLLVEAVDASYAMGFLDALVSGYVRPYSGLKQVLLRFGRKALRHWFEHATTKDLMQIKIYETVRKQLAFVFGGYLVMHANGVAKNEVPYFGLLACEASSSVVWG